MSEPRPPSKERTDDLADRVDEHEDEVDRLNDLMDRLLDVQEEQIQQVQDVALEPLVDRDDDLRGFR
jgi:coenzyme F420-reducing hydrogenase alpha subunit